MTDTMPTGPTVDHATYIGGSDIGAVLGLSPWGGKLSVYGEKVEGLKLEETEAMYMGTHGERTVVNAYLKYRRPEGTKMAFPGTLLLPEPHQYLGATPDGYENDRISVQIKITNARSLSFWGDETDNEDGVPTHVLAQTYWEAGVLNAVGMPCDTIRCIVSCGTDMKVFTYGHEPEVFDGYKEQAIEFWRDYIEAKVRPIDEADDSALLARIHKNVTGEIKEMDAEVKKLCRQYLAEAEMLKKLETAHDFTGNLIRHRIADALGFEDGEGLVAKWAPRKGSISYKKIVDDLDVPTEKREEYRGEGTRALSVRQK